MFAVGAVFFILPLLLLIAFVGAVVKMTPSLPAPKAHVFESDNIANVLTPAPADHPENLKGIFWMDQLGHYAHSDIPMGAPDLGLTFSDPIDKSTRVQEVSVFGPNWQWMNNKFALVFVRMTNLLGCFYTFQWNADYTAVQILPSTDFGFMKIRVPSFIMSFTMVKQTPPEGACPPKPGATKREISKCAAWDRVSGGLIGPKLHYYVFQIVDADGNKVQPYYDKYLEWAQLNESPAPDLAKALGYDLGPDAGKKGMSFIASPPAQKKKKQTKPAPPHPSNEEL